MKRTDIARNEIKPGPGWKQLASDVWEHATGVRIHTGGLVRLESGRHIELMRFGEGERGNALIAANGGNTKRGLMAWALSPNTPRDDKCRHTVQ